MTKISSAFILALALSVFAEIAHADDQNALPQAQDADGTPGQQNWSLHVQSTGIYQGYPAFHSPYQGTNSLPESGGVRESATATAFLGGRLPWQGGEQYFDPEAYQGFGIGQTAGIAAFPSGEAQKAGREDPEMHVARLFLRQTFGFGGEQETLDPDQNQLGETVDVSRLTVTIGKLAVTDIFDANAYSHDARSQFMNIALSDGGAYDYAADQKGYTYGGVLELNQKDWALRSGYFLVPKEANSLELDRQAGKYGAANVELETRYDIFAEPGKFRVLGFANQANAGSFSDTLADPSDGTDIALTRKDRTKYGFVLNLEQAITDDLGIFSRYSWNDGQEENVSYADIDASFSLGASLKGTSWDRPHDVVGLGGAMNMLSDAEREFLAAGGTGLIIGDGRLNYAPEGIMETYYSYQIADPLSLTFDYQFVANPAYNQDRGPVNVFAGRLHLQF